MDRAQFIKDKRQTAENRYDTRFAPTYDEDWGNISPSHQQMIEKLLEHVIAGGLILDAACGTGKYWPLILASGRQVYGIDQSAGMLAQARAKHPEVPTEKRWLQELSANNQYDAIICVDAMENFFPEDWPLVLKNFQLALKPGGWLYFTIELPDENLNEALEKGRALGYPVEPGEVVLNGGYHYYPTPEQVREWTARAGFRVTDEAEGDYYWHLLVQRD